jgi:hypothetical protein
MDQMMALGRPTTQLLVSVGVLTGSVFDTALGELDSLSAQVATAPERTLASHAATIEMSRGRPLPAGELPWVLLALWCLLLLVHHRRRRPLRRIRT